MSSQYTDYGYKSGDDPWTTQYLLPCISRMLDERSGPILDLGCGNGSIARRLLQAGHDVYGVDASPSGISAASAVAPGRFFVMDVNDRVLPVDLASIRFKTVISTEVIEHLYDPSLLLRMARQAMGRSGRLIVSTPYHGYVKNLALALTGKLDSHFTALWLGGHIKFFSRASLERLLVQEGYVPDAFVGAGRMPWLWKSMVIGARLAE